MNKTGKRKSLMRVFFAVVVAALAVFLGLLKPSLAQSKTRKSNRLFGASKMNAKKGQSASNLEELIPRLMKDADVPGLSAAVIKNGKIVWHRGFGVKNVETKEPVDDTTVFEAASLSKTVFAYAVLKMVEDGKLDLDIPLHQYLPAPFVENDERINQITVRRVLSHTTGFPNWRGNGKPLKIYFTPGERFSYSGEGYIYLQKIVEKISGLPLQDFMKRMVFEPLGMTNSSYIWQPKYEALKSYAHDASGKLVGKSKPYEANAAASLQTTALDYAKFIEAILRRKAIKETTVREMLRPQVSVETSCAVCFERPASGKFSPVISWGLGWGLEKTPEGDSFWHWGDNGNVKAYVAAFDKSKNAVIVFSNGANGLSITKEIIGSALGVKQTALDWLNYEPYNSPAKTLLRDILVRGDKAVLEYRNSGKNRSSKKLSESQINWIGYQLLGRNRFDEAIKILELNAADFPQSKNVYDSLGEAYLKSGNIERATENYRKVIELNPQNIDTANVLKRLQNMVKVETNFLDSCAGNYQTPFGTLTIVRDKGLLVGRVAGESDTIFLPQTKNQFVEAIKGIQLTFIKDEKGSITHMIILINGQEIRAERIKR